MNLTIDYPRDLDLFQIEEQEKDIVVSHFSFFDRDTGETDGMALRFKKLAFRRALQQFRDEGFCEVAGS